MNEISKANLSQQTKFLLNEISKIEDYFHQDIIKGSHAVKN